MISIKYQNTFFSLSTIMLTPCEFYHKTSPSLLKIVYKFCLLSEFPLIVDSGPFWNKSIPIFCDASYILNPFFVTLSHTSMYGSSALLLYNLYYFKHHLCFHISWLRFYISKIQAFLVSKLLLNNHIKHRIPISSINFHILIGTLSGPISFLTSSFLELY